MNSTLSAISSDPYWTVHCRPRGSLCDDGSPYVVTVTGSHDVVLRYEAVGDNGDGNGVARVRVVGGKSSDQVAQLIEISGFLVLQLSATKGGLDVQLLRQQFVGKVVNQGSGTVTVESNVLVTSGPSLVVSVVGSGNVLVTSTASVSVDKLSLVSQGKGQIQASFADFHVKSMSMNVYFSGSTTVSTTSSSAVDDLTLGVQGSGSMCLSSDSSLDINELTIGAIGSGDISLGPQGSCKNAMLTAEGSGFIDTGGIQCQSVDVDLLGSGSVIVQATDVLSGDVYGSGRLEYSGIAPHSIDNVNYMGLVTATPVSSSYEPGTCKVPPLKPSAIPPEQAKPTNKTIPAALKDTMRNGQSDIISLVVVVVLVALILRWFNESRRRAREEQRQPLVAEQRRVYV
ncbi:hypothetical protein PHYBOEH_000680 [Phytophthora boehmeriae]|uniref:Putative auto-transporter adhesin head GIN domain-containing protein n=1 Tax=Phytophthora boehmeriae TaxID=109152 RepID=A0A8T1VC71_9STRA|nr:hypothetical protein PHYBOEH_000680 [Phytophthora boehmeriae]